MINSIGLQNIGVRAFIRDKLPALARLQTAVFANVFGYATEDYVEVVRALEGAEGLAGYELNVSCPNTRHGGIYFSSDPALLAEVVGAVRAVARRPLIVKLSPNVARIEPLARAAVEAGADAISLVNTFVALAVDARARRPRIGAGFGGLSGPPSSLSRCGWCTRRRKQRRFGDRNGRHRQRRRCGRVSGCRRNRVEVGTATFWDPASPLRVAHELREFLRLEKIGSVRS